ncbi:MAG: fibrobacter succinogenes major paralogous domain-containing protein [Crocinitomicaceae bacterium]|nr:fibrobacter succinogenes major paralogous domain-containing protein [Crocinitomicaceae bacterium]
MKQLIILFNLIALIACSSVSEKRIASNNSYIEIPAVRIDDQFWSISNLSVDTFQNGDPIPEAKTSEEWNVLGKEGKAGFCYYDFDASNDTISGKLYNWYAVNDQRGIAPEGWRAPTNEDWDGLIKKAGGRFKAGIKLKSQNGWQDHFDEPADSGTDEYELSLLPTGELHNDGVFAAKSTMGVYWTSTSYDGQPRWGDKQGMMAWDVVIWYSNDMAVKLQTFPKRGSGAIRCVRDK